MTASKIVAAAASGVGGGAGLDVDEVFNTFVYDGNNTGQSIVNGIDLSGEGGLVWTKSRAYAVDHALVDTVRGNTKYLQSHNTSAEASSSVGITAFNNNGYTLGADNTWIWNVSNSYVKEYVSWTFRKAPKFFDIVTYTGNSINGTTVNHNLGSVPGMIIVKNISHGSSNWRVYHRGSDSSAPEDYVLLLNGGNERYDSASFWNDTAPTSTQFTLGGDDDVNDHGDTYVAYLFAHNNNDGGFGPDSDQDVIKCGSFTKGDTGTSNFINVNLGFEVQWLLTKSTADENWDIYDVQRGMSLTQAKPIRPNLSSAEGNFASQYIYPTSTGFAYQDNNASTYIYMAIRRGPLAAPTDATKVFAMDTLGGTSPTPPGFNSGFPVDMAFLKPINSSSDWLLASRLIQGKQLVTNSNPAEVDETANVFDYQNGYYNFSSSASNYQAWMWKRAPSWFECVCYDGTGSVRTVSHNLGAVPEMIWVKRRDSGGSWGVWHKDLTSGYYLGLDTDDAQLSNSNVWTTTNPTATQFSVGTQGFTNNSSGTFIAYLFATVDGVSKVGNFTLGSSGSSNIDCGFSSGARFILAKKKSGTGGWLVWDTVRGIVAGNDPYLLLNSNAAETGGYDFVDPYSQGFTIPEASYWGAGDYIFYAIA